jgi:hypothetical protein
MGVSNQASDAPHLELMLERIMANTGQMPETLITDAGYRSPDNILRGLEKVSKVVAAKMCDRLLGDSQGIPPASTT